MATILLSVAGAAIGGGLLGPVGAILGRAAGAVAGSIVDQRLLSKDQVIRGPRLDEARIMSSSDGAPMPKAYGRVRLGGQLIWATRFEAVTRRRKTGGKGGPATAVENTAYFGNFAIGICEGPIAAVQRIWADGVEIDRTRYEIRVHAGAEDQQADPLIAAKQGAGGAPAFRGTAYAVFEFYPLETHGNRIPQFSFEVIRSVGRLDRLVRAVTVIPGATEFGLHPDPIAEERTGSRIVNRHVTTHATDWAASLDELQALCPALESVALVVAWFGNDLRAGSCRVEPRVEHPGTGPEWSVSTIERHSAAVVSRFEDRPAYGGTPSDNAVLAAIMDLKRRGLRVVLYPFVMMDIPAENALPDPWGAQRQEAYPWRGRITCDPAPGRPQTADRTAAARRQIEAFAGSIRPDAFSRAGNSTGGAVTCSSQELSYRRMVLHYAHLCRLAGGVDGFLIGSEFKALTTIRDQAGAHPFVEHLMVLAAEVRDIVGAGTKITYGADWTEYFGYQPEDAPGDRLFHLDPLWAHPAINAIGIDNYMPLSDWREGGDPGDGRARTQCDPDYLGRNIAGGEGFDWYHASAADRAAGRRTPISDGSGEAWIWRYKDLVSWWSNAHHERIGGARKGTPTPWRPKSKPIWFTELGCAAVTMGANAPNLFPDRKSAASGLPYASTGARSDILQTRFIDAHFRHWTDPSNNPLSPVFGARMVDTGRIHLWAWDARPFPAFPAQGSTWSDGSNWHTGHWLNGRIGGAPLDDLLKAIAADFGIAAEAKCDGFVDGYAVTGPMPARAALQPLSDLFGLDASDNDGILRFSARPYAQRADIPQGDIVDNGEQPRLRLERDQEIDMPREIELSHADLFADYETGHSYSRRLETASCRIVSMQLPAVLPRAAVSGIVEARLREAWIGRDRAILALPMRHAALEPGDLVRFGEELAGSWRIESIEDGEVRRLTLRSSEAVEETLAAVAPPNVASPPPVAHARPKLIVMNLPVTPGVSRPKVHVALDAEPWAGAYAIWSSPSQSGFELRLTTASRAISGTLVEPIAPGPEGRYDIGNRLRVRLLHGTLASEPEANLLNGANAAAIRARNGEWEVLQFRDASLEADGTWTLGRLLRAQLGTDPAMLSGADAGCDFVLLDASVEAIELEALESGLTLNWRAGPASDPASAASYGAVSHVHSAAPQRPYSPVHLTAERLTGGNIRIAWTRRTRLGGDDWEAAEVPLDELAERYRLTVLSDAGVAVRAIEITTPSFTYSLAEQHADFGAEATAFTVSVAQVGASGLPGAPRMRAFSL